MLHSTSLTKSPLLATLFPNRLVDERPEVVFNAMSSKQMAFLDIHCLWFQ
jgi:hypothetical protein